MLNSASLLDEFCFKSLQSVSLLWTNARFISSHESKVHQILAKFGKVVDSVIEFVSNLLVIGYQMIKITAFFSFNFPPLSYVDKVLEITSILLYICTILRATMPEILQTSKYTYRDFQTAIVMLLGMCSTAL